MKFEKVRLLRTLKLGDKVYQGGKEYYPPLPPDMLKEIALGSPHVEVIKSDLDVAESPTASESPEEVESPKKPSRLVRRRIG